MSALEPNRLMNINSSNQKAPPNSVAIGGWLILFAIGLVIYPIRSLILLATDLIPAFSGDTWWVLTSPASGHYHPLWAPLLIGELIGNTIFMIFSVSLIILFFVRRKIIPRLTIIFLIANLVFVSIDFYLVRLLPAAAQQADYQALTDWIQTLVACLIWVPYFIISKRVKTTFVK